MTQIDALGLLCPLPVLKARKALKSLSAGDLLIITTDDPAAVIDMPHFCNESGHELTGQEEQGDAIRWTIRKGA
jgi:tRNA 2-thiouridine synthesizing protein A